MRSNVIEITCNNKGLQYRMEADYFYLVTERKGIGNRI